MENDFDNRIKDDIPQKASSRKRWTSLIIWPTFIITIIIFVLSMVPFERDVSGKINIHKSINNLVKIVTRKENVRIEIIRPNENFLSIRSAIEAYILNTNKYPTTLNDLVKNPGLQGWCGPYLKPSQLQDQFGNPYIYIPDTKGNYKLISYGADGLPGGKGDNADILND